MSKKSTLSTALATAAGRPMPESAAETPSQEGNAQPPAAKPATVLIAAHFAPEVRRVLKLVEADTGKNLKQLLGEAINDLAAKYRKPEPYTTEADSTRRLD